MPQIADRLTGRDHLGTVGARIGIIRNRYLVSPGLYALGRPQADSPVLVTANYKLTFDSLRKELTGLNAWLIVADTRGINVWCAAGKGTFSSEEIAYQVEKSRLAEIVTHRRLILPQCGAPGVSARRLKALCGFMAVFGPVRAEDIKPFLAAGAIANEEMRSVTFTIRERAALIPIELYLLIKPLAITLLVLTLLSGLGADGFAIADALHRGGSLAVVILLAVLSGAVLAPLLLPWLPGRQFWWKGALLGSAIAILAYLRYAPLVGGTAAAGMALVAIAISSFVAMNFTGSTPYTSLSGVALEMRTGLAVQLVSMTIGLACWLIGPFIG